MSGVWYVSTHSRPKAAAFGYREAQRPNGFNTQPPEGGCKTDGYLKPDLVFQHTAARRRLACEILFRRHGAFVSTHSRPKAAVRSFCFPFLVVNVSTHSRPKAAGRWSAFRALKSCFNTQPPEGGCFFGAKNGEVIRSFNTQPPEGGWEAVLIIATQRLFQHTAARRRLIKNRFPD